jgi:hypothetical protein
MSTHRIRPASLLRICGAVLGVALLGLVASQAFAYGAKADVKQLIQSYWEGRQVAWPRGVEFGELPQEEAVAMRSTRTAMVGEIVRGALAQHVLSFDPADFLEEELREYGEVTTASEFEILSLSNPVMVAPGVVRVDVTISELSEVTRVGTDGSAGSLQTVARVNEYRYVCRMVRGKWRLVEEDLLSSPL